jgi:hypothetical protein
VLQLIIWFPILSLLELGSGVPRNVAIRGELLTNSILDSGHGFDDPQPVDCATRKVYDRNRRLIRFDKGMFNIDDTRQLDLRSMG